MKGDDGQLFEKVIPAVLSFGIRRLMPLAAKEFFGIASNGVPEDRFSAPLREL